MKTINLILLFTASIFCQDFYFYYNGGVSIEPETNLYISRVESDGGEVLNPSLVNDFIAEAKATGYYDSLICVIDANFGVKKNANNKVSKIYDLIGSYDYSQSDTSKAPSWIASSQNGLAGLIFDGINDVMTVTINKVGEAQPYSLYTTFKRLGTANGVNFVDDVSRSTILGITNDNFLFIYSGTILADNVSLNNGTSYIYTGVFESAASQIYLNNAIKIEGNAGTGIFGQTPAGNEVYYLGASPPETQWTNFILYDFIAKHGKGNILNINIFLNSKFIIF